MSRKGYDLVRVAKGGGGEGFRHAVVTARTAINGAVRFRYTLTLGHWNMKTDGDNGGAWVAGRTGQKAFNSTEDLNTFASTGDIGTGNSDVEQSDGTIDGGSCALLPIPIGAYVIVVRRGSGYWTIVNFENSAQEP